MPDLARLYDRHAEDCARAAEQTDDPRARAMLIKLVDEWRKAAQELRQPQEQPPPRTRRPNCLSRWSSPLV
jgi:DNA primase